MLLERTSIGALADVASGGAAPQDPAAFTERGHPFVRAGSLTKLLDGASEGSMEKLAAATAKSHRLRLFPSGTVLFAKSGMSALKGHVYALRQPAYVVSHLAALVPRDPYDSGFLVHALRHHSPAALAKGGAYPSIRLPDIAAMPILAPIDPAGRHRIADILDRALELRTARQRTIVQLDSLVQSIFVDMFGDPGRNERKWPMATVHEYVAAFQGGRSMDSVPGPIAEAAYRVLKISAVTGTRFRAEESEAVPEWFKPRAEHLVKPGDLLFSRANTAELVGAVARVAVGPQNLLLPDKLWRFVWREPARVDPTFVWALFCAPAVHSAISRRATGTGGSMKNISQKKVLAIKTILPPLPVQEQFAHRVEVLDGVRDRAVAAAEESEALFVSLQQDAFRGEL